MSGTDVETLANLLDRLIPGDADFPMTSQISLAPRLIAHERFGPMAGAVVAALPNDFAALPEAAQITAIQAVEHQHAEALGALLTALYSLYYTDLTVLAAIERVSGYRAGPPQPRGYQLPAFDPASVAIPASRGRQYREITEVTS